MNNYFFHNNLHAFFSIPFFQLDFRELKTLPGSEQPERRKELRKKHKVL